MKSHYLKMDFYRFFFSAQMILAVLGVCAVHILIPQQFIEPRVSVLRSFNVAWSSNAMVLAYIFTTFAYGQSFCEDMEQGYYKYGVIRGKQARYAMSKCIVIIFSAIFTMAAGRFLFVVGMRLFYPWEAPFDLGEVELLMEVGCFSGLLKEGHYLIYVLIHGIWQGIWAAVLALFSAFISFYTANRLLVLAFPVMLHHLLRRVSHLWNDDWVKFDPDHIFLINYNAWGNERISLSAGAGSGLFLCLLLTWLICRKFKRRAENG